MKMLTTFSWKTSASTTLRVVENRPTQDTFLKSQGKFFCHFDVPFLKIFLTSKNYKMEPLKSFLGRYIFHYYYFCNI